MTALFDTSVLVAALVESHPRHSPAFAWLARAHRGEVTGIIAAHSIAEMFAVLTSLPLNPGIAPPTAWTLLERIVTLNPDDFRRVADASIVQEP